MGSGGEAKKKNLHALVVAAVVWPIARISRQPCRHTHLSTCFQPGTRAQVCYTRRCCLVFGRVHRWSGHYTARQAQCYTPFVVSVQPRQQCILPSSYLAHTRHSRHATYVSFAPCACVCTVLSITWARHRRTYATATTHTEAGRTRYIAPNDHQRMARAHALPSVPGKDAVTQMLSSGSQ